MLRFARYHRVPELDRYFDDGSHVVLRAPPTAIHAPISNITVEQGLAWLAAASDVPRGEVRCAGGAGPSLSPGLPGFRLGTGPSIGTWLSHIAT